MKIPVLVGAIGSLIALPIIIILAIFVTSKPIEMEWRPFVLEEGGFSIELPGVAEVKKGEITPHSFLTNQMVFATALRRNAFLEKKVWGGAYFEIGSEYQGKRALDQILHAALIAPLKKRSAEIVAEKDLILNGFIGKEVEFKVPFLSSSSHVAGYKRVYVANNRVYELHMLIYPRLNFFSKPDKDEANRFFNSFQLIDPTQKQATLKNKLSADV